MVLSQYRILKHNDTGNRVYFMLLQPCHKLVDITDEVLGSAHFLQFSVVCFVCDVSGVIFNVDNHRIQLTFIKQGKQLLHPGAARAVGCYIDTFDLGRIRLRVSMKCTIRCRCGAWSRGS
ncbi:hypothetical protein D3C76_1352390 [compost metagenome]